MNKAQMGAASLRLYAEDYLNMLSGCSYRNTLNSHWQSVRTRNKVIEMIAADLYRIADFLDKEMRAMG